MEMSGHLHAPSITEGERVPVSIACASGKAPVCLYVVTKRKAGIVFTGSINPIDLDIDGTIMLKVNLKS
jgi:hypothetical protein